MTSTPCCYYFVDSTTIITIIRPKITAGPAFPSATGRSGLDGLPG